MRAMLLALAGSLIASWLSARNRLTNFAVLRALGASPPQIASMLLWEQTIVYSTSLLSGLCCGALLSLLALPAIIFTSVSTTGVTSNLSSEAFFVLQNVPPVELVVPLTLLIVLRMLIVICAVTLAIMIGVVSRPSIGQTLRLNAD
jgi:ABC-type antimicrobial peptide transport system permease subunit